jgi:hypothetical protein
MPVIHLEPIAPGLTRADVLRFVCEAGAIDGDLVLSLELRGGSAHFEVPDSWEARLLEALDVATLGGQTLRARSGGQPSSQTDDHFARLGELLELESKAEANQVLERVARLSPQEAERAGTSLTDLVIQEGYAGLGGRYILTLSKRGSRPIPWTRIGPGAPVVLSAQGTGAAKTGSRGVVSERAEFFVRVAFNEPPDDDAGPIFRLDLTADEAARMRQRQALERARSARGDRLAHLRAVLLGQREPAFGPPADEDPLDVTLDESQRAAVRFALSAADVAVIHGPPGTGKTTTLVELIRRAVRRGEKVLVCAPSNLAVDNVLERLLARGEKAVRLGHPARVLPQLREHTLDLIVEDHPDVRQARKYAKEAFALFRKAGKWTRSKPAPGARRDQREEARSLLADARRMEAQAVEQILDRAPILCATTTGLDGELIGSRRFDLLVIDEACQTTEPGCWVPLGRAGKVVLAGDHRQLPPTVLSPEAARLGFGVSLLERLVALCGDRVTRRLDVQYRMHEAIMTFSSNEFYDGTLQAHASVRGHRLCDLPGVAANPLTELPVEYIDTAGAGYDSSDGRSKRSCLPESIRRRSPSSPRTRLR